MIQQVTVWMDSQGKYHPTEADAIAADEEVAVQKEINDIVTILQTTSRNLGRSGLPGSIQHAAEILIAAYPAVKAYYGD